MALNSTSGNVDIVSDGGSDTLTGGSFSNRWGIDNYDGKYVLKNANNTSSALRCTAAYPGADILTGTYSASDSYFHWTLNRLSNLPNGVILYDTSTNRIVTNPTKTIRPGATSTLSSLGLTIVVHSGNDVNQDVTWTSSNTSVATVANANGAVTGVTYGVACITAYKTIDGTVYSQSYTLVVSEIPVSGSELAYEPELWNYSPVEVNTNCYAYALDNQVHPGANTLWYMQPGEAAGYTLTSDVVDSEIVIDYVKADAAELGFTFTEIDRDAYCSPGAYKVALVIAPGQDYHWYRQNPDGTWSHKLGWLPVTDQDARNNIIEDPETANRHHSVYYSVFAGYFEVTPLSNMYSTSLYTLSFDNVDHISIEKNKSILPSNLDASMIHQGMTYSEVTEKIGLPQRQLTNGLRVVEYELSDSSTLVVEYVMKQGQLIVYSCAINGGVNYETN